MFEDVKVIIAGGRDFDDYAMMKASMIQVQMALAKEDKMITEVVSGRARGADIFGETWAWNSELPVKLFPADWKQYGKSAGIKRNLQMAGYADVLVAFWDGHSRGTSHMIKAAEHGGLSVFMFEYEPIEVFAFSEPKGI